MAIELSGSDFSPSDLSQLRNHIRHLKIAAKKEQDSLYSKSAEAGEDIALDVILGRGFSTALLDRKNYPATVDKALRRLQLLAGDILSGLFDEMMKLIILASRDRRDYADTVYPAMNSPFIDIKNWRQPVDQAIKLTLPWDNYKVVQVSQPTFDASIDQGKIAGLGRAFDLISRPRTVLPPIPSGYHKADSTARNPEGQIMDLLPTTLPRLWIGYLDKSANSRGQTYLFASPAELRG